MNGKEQNQSKKQVYHLFIFNDEDPENYYMNTLSIIRIAQKKYSDTQDHYVTVITSSCNGIEVVEDVVPINKLGTSVEENQLLCKSTSLRDAIGEGIVKMLFDTKDVDDPSVFVTILSNRKVKTPSKWRLDIVYKLIEKCKNEGWIFNFVGDNEFCIKSV